jgi:S1-C subfamily serine protease
VNIPALLLSFVVLSGPASSAEQVDIRVDGAALRIELKEQKVVVSEAAPEGYWPVSRGDVVVRINGRSVARPEELLVVWREEAGSEFEFELIRHGKLMKFKAGAVDFPGLGLPRTPEPPAPARPPSPSPPQRTE